MGLWAIYDNFVDAIKLKNINVSDLGRFFTREASLGHGVIFAWISSMDRGFICHLLVGYFTFFIPHIIRHFQKRRLKRMHKGLGMMDVCSWLRVA